ncbi:MAG: SUMF1/EgtB/PvdO family nonheme iron enzyme [Bacteroidota bacterium]
MRYILLFFCLLPAVSFVNPARETRVLTRADKDYALFFAVQKYKEWEDLRNPIRDASAIAKLLIDNYDFSEKNIEIVQNPTKSQVYETLNRYLTKVYEDDAQLLIFFSGHGEFNTLTNEGFFIPKDAKLNDKFQDSYLPHTRLERSIDNIPCSHILLAIDACYSGTFDENIALERLKSSDRKDWRRPGANNEYLKTKWINEKLEKRSRLFLTSGGKERTPDGIDNSPFTIGILNSLTGNNLEDEILTFDELKASMKNVVPEPRAGNFGSHQIGGNFLFIRSVEEENSIDVDAYDRRRQDLEAWEKAKITNTVSAYQDYLDRFPNGSFRVEARERIDDLVEELEWNVALAKNTIEGYDDYVRKYPNGFYTNEAINTRDELLYSSVTTAESNDNFFLSEDLLKRHSMVDIIGDTFSMGCTGNDCYKNELPLHLVRVGDFKISPYEVTNLQYVAFLNESQENRKSPFKKRNFVSKIKDITKRGDKYLIKKQLANYPVMGVSWEGAVAYCEWLNEGTAYSFRLPTEAEWEYAARGGRKSGNYIYAGTNNLADLSKEDNIEKQPIYEVGKTRANELGLYDMSSNAWEWVQDCEHSNYRYAPSDGSAWLEDNGQKCSSRMIRGGWAFLFERKAVSIRTSENYNYDDLYEHESDPKVAKIDIGRCGFRVAHD